MKAKLYIFQEKMELKLADDTFYTPKKGEEKEAFVERVKKIVEEEYLEDLELIEIDAEVVASNDDEALQEAFKTAEGLQKKLIEAVLKERGVIETKAPREKVEKRSKEDMQDSPEYKEAEAQIGKICTFSPHKSEEVYTGKIAGIALNKTNTRIYYTVVEEGGKRRCCAVLNETVVLSDAPASEAKEKTAKAPKAEAAKPKADTKKQPLKVAGKTVGKKDDAGDDLV